MTSEQFDRVRDLYSRAVEISASRRAGFLDQECMGDVELRREVESLLAEHERIGTFMEEPALETAARNMLSARRESWTGKRIAHYEILSFLDAGGMGEVYRSRDTKLKRDVAIKILPAEWSQDTDRVRRFKREAELLAAVNHPRIAQIYGLEEFGETLCLVMELVEGETLAERIARDPIPQERALEIACQIAEALEAAHEREIIHRDLKPANIKLTPDGNVKVLDFGLAKDISPAGANPSGSQSPVLVDVSLPGVILGTAGYMSPEQAKGRAAGTRSDVWAFGCVLFEMLAGKTAFPGDSVVERLSAILRAEPDWTALPESTPGSIRSLLKRCLQKDIARRLRNIADARFQIEEARAEPPIPQEPVPVIHKSLERGLWAAALLVLVIAVIALAVSNRSVEVDAPEMRLQIVTPPESSPSSFTLSPDGRNLVFFNQAQYWLRSLDSERAELLPGTENAGMTFWSPDSRSIGFSASDRLKRFDIGGRLAMTVSNVPIGIGTRNGSWSKDGNLLIGPPGDWMPIFLFDVRGGNAVTVTNLEPGQTTQAYPYFLPDGRHFLFFSRTTDGQGIYAGSLNSKETHRLFDSDSAAVFSPPDYVLFARRGALLAQRLDLKTMSSEGAAISISPEVFVDTSVGSTSVRASIAASASTAGPIAYRAHADRTQLGWVDRTGRLIHLISGTEQSDILQPDDLRLAPDGHTAAFARTVDGNKDIWLIDLDRGLPRRFTSNKAWDGRPIWSPDGKRLVFSTLRKGVLDLYQRPADETELETPLMESHEGKVAHDWSMDGRYILYQSSNPQTSDDIWAMPLFGDRKPVPVVRTPSLECCPRFSPDGHTVAYQSWETGRSEIYVQPFMGTAGKQRISSEGGVSVRWRADGRELFYRAPDGRLMAVSIQKDGEAIKAGTPAPLFRVPAVYIPSPDGQRFLVNVVTEPASPITILLNWNRLAK